MADNDHFVVFPPVNKDALDRLAIAREAALRRRSQRSGNHVVRPGACRLVAQTNLIIVPRAERSPAGMYAIPDITLGVGETHDMSQYIATGDTIESSQIIGLDTNIATYDSSTMLLTGVAGGTMTGLVMEVVSVEATVGFTYTATHYVAPWASVSGATSDTDTANGTAYSSATSISTPCTLGEALANATAGHVIQCAAGVYSGTTTDSRFAPAWRFTNSGTSGNPIIIYAVNPATSTAVTANRSKLTHNGDITTPSGCPTMGAYGENYVIWDGFWVDEATANPTADTGPCIFGPGSTGAEIRRAVIDGMDVSVGDTWASVGAENHNAFRFEGANDCWARDCEVNNIKNPSGTHNGAAVMVYSDSGSSGCGVEYCNFDDVGCGVYVKGQSAPNTNGNFTVRNNIISNFQTVGIEYGGHTGAARSKVYCNIVRDGSQDGIMLFRDEVQNVDVFNNTIARVNRGFYFQNPSSGTGTAATVKNNIVYDVVTGGDTPRFAVYEAGTDDTDTSPDYNCYYDPSSTNGWYINSTSYTDFATYDAALTGTNEDNSVNVDPLFTDAANSDFTLTGSSTLANAGSDYLSVFGETPDIGAYAVASTTIGVRSEPNYA